MDNWHVSRTRGGVRKRTRINTMVVRPDITVKRKPRSKTNDLYQIVKFVTTDRISIFTAIVSYAYPRAKV